MLIQLDTYIVETRNQGRFMVSEDELAMFTRVLMRSGIHDWKVEKYRIHSEVVDEAT